MTRVMTKPITPVLLALLLLVPVSTAAGDKEGPSSREVKQMIKFGISLGKQGLWKEALYRWREALRYDPDNPQLHNNIAVALESQGDLKGARESYKRADELDGKAKYIGRNIADFEELFTALEQYEEQYRKPPAGEAEGGETSGDGDAAADAAPGDDQTSAEAAAGEEADPAEKPELGAAAPADDPGVDDPGTETDPPAGDQIVEEGE